MQNSNVIPPAGLGERGSKARKAEAAARKGSLRRKALRDAIDNG